MTEVWEQQVDFVRSMPTSAAKILWILFLSGRSLTGRELQLACNMSDKTIGDGLIWLEFKGLVQNNGKFNGWSLAAGFYQLPLPLSALPASHGEATPPAQHGGAVDNSADNVVDDGLETRNFSVFGRETRKNSVFLPSSSSSSGREEEFKTAGARAREANAPLRQLLIDAGIGARSPKLREIVSLGLALDYVEDHVQAWRARREPVSYLIRRLLDGDPVPAALPEPDGRLCPDCGAPIHGRECLFCAGVIEH